MQKHNWKYGLMSAVAMLFIFGSYTAVYAKDAALAKTVFYVQ
jgi:energy-converting hydrogenase Eha subunit H